MALRHPPAALVLLLLIMHCHRVRSLLLPLRYGGGVTNPGGTSRRLHHTGVGARPPTGSSLPPPRGSVARLTLATAAAVSLAAPGNATRGSSSLAVQCSPAIDDGPCGDQLPEPFPADWMQYDHYGGVILTLPPLSKDVDTNAAVEQDATVFAARLQRALAAWIAEGRRGIWIHVPSAQAAAVPACIQQGFAFHTVVSSTNGDHDVATGDDDDDKVLVLSRWLPRDVPNRLPPGPTHQVGVGCLVFHPEDDDSDMDPGLRRMLVVRERTGPAASWRLWKMPTGLADPGEDLHVTAVRELKEETNLTATFRGVLTLRQAHPVAVTPVAATSSGQPTRSVVLRSHSDLFAICVLDLVVDAALRPHLEDLAGLPTCPDEIAGMQWMTVADYASQERWQSSPAYQEINDIIKHATRHALLEPATLPLGFGTATGAANTLYRSRRATGDTKAA